jgi:hypothetical protein
MLNQPSSYKSYEFSESFGCFAQSRFCTGPVPRLPNPAPWSALKSYPQIRRFNQTEAEAVLEYVLLLGACLFAQCRSG